MKSQPCGVYICVTNDTDLNTMRLPKPYAPFGKLVTLAVLVAIEYLPSISTSLRSPERKPAFVSITRDTECYATEIEHSAPYSFTHSLHEPFAQMRL